MPERSVVTLPMIESGVRSPFRFEVVAMVHRTCFLTEFAINIVAVAYLHGVCLVCLPSMPTR